MATASSVRAADVSVDDNDNSLDRAPFTFPYSSSPYSAYSYFNQSSAAFSNDRNEANDDAENALRGLGNWSSFGHDVLNSRFNPLEYQIRPGNVSRLGLKWAFVFPGAVSASSQPAIVGNALYVGGWNGHFYSLDARTGNIKWDFDTASFTGPLPSGTNAVRNGPAVVGGLVYFGDLIGNFYAVNTSNGTLAWAKRLDSHPTARITGSPLVWNGRVYIGVSSVEVGAALNPFYPCCTFRGSVVALDARTGAETWRYYTIAQTAQPTGVNSVGTPQYGPAGVAVWSTPSLDPLSGLLYITTGNNYTTPATDRSDSIIALDARTGQERWHNQLTPNDNWNLSCNPESIGLPPGAGPNCRAPDLENNDFDFGSPANVFVARTADGRGFRVLVGAGQKSGIYHALDARTGQVVWQRQLSQGGVAGVGGIQWGSSWDGERLYVATHVANPGTLYALDPATGQIKWHTPNPADGCSTGGAVAATAATGNPANCRLALPAATSVTPGLVFEGSWDGKLRAYNSRTGTIAWQYDTVRSYTGTNGGGITGNGGTINGAGASIANGMVYVNSGYQPFPGSGMPGNVLLAFGLS